MPLCSVVPKRVPNTDPHRTYESVGSVHLFSAVEVGRHLPVTLIGAVREFVEWPDDRRDLQCVRKKEFWLTVSRFDGSGRQKRANPRTGPGQAYTGWGTNG